MCIEETQNSQIECRSLSPEIPFTGSVETISSQEEKKTCARIACNTCTINNDGNKLPHSDDLDTNKVLSDIEGNLADLNNNKIPGDIEDNVGDLNTNKTSSDIEDVSGLDPNKAACDVEVSSNASIDNLLDSSSNNVANMKKNEGHLLTGLPTSDTSFCDTDTMEKHYLSDTEETCSRSHKKKKKKKKKKDKHEKDEEPERSSLERLPHTLKQSQLSPKRLMPPPSEKPTAFSAWSPRTISTKNIAKSSDHPDFIFTATGQILLLASIIFHGLIFLPFNYPCIETECSSDDSCNGEISTGPVQQKKPRKPSLLSALAKHGK